MTNTRNYIVRQRDFSGGEVVEHAKRRDDEAVVRSACRTLRNARILSTGAVEQRAGRSALFQEAAGRTEKVKMSPDYLAYLCFGEGTLTIRNASGAPVARAWGYDWTAATAKQASWAQMDKDIVITFPGQVPKIARWDGGTEWTLLDWEAHTTSGGQKRVPFYRISPKNITMLPAARTGTGVAVTFSTGMALLTTHVGTRMRFVGRQVTIASRGGPTTGTIDINEPLPGSQILTFGSDPRNVFALGEIVEGSETGARGYITASNATTITLQLLQTTTTLSGVDEGGGGAASGLFTTSDIVVGAGGVLTPSSVGAIGNPVAVPMWDEEVFNSFQGWPRSVSNDQNRLIFTDFPGVPAGIGWSALGSSDDLYPGAEPTDAIFETVPRKARVYHVTGGADEFAVTDRGIYYIPISEANPLRPGSVAFRRVPGPSGSAVRPVETAQGIIYANNGLNRVLAIVGTGQTAMPWLIRPVSDLHSHLFSSITCLAAEEGDGDPPDEQVYAVNADGTVAVGRYQPGKEWAGWLKWTGEGDVKWVSVLGASVVFTTDYDSGGLVEEQDPDRYLDAAVDYDAIPAPLGTGAQADILMPDDQGELGGNMTAAGGLAASRDGTSSQLAAACASKTGTTTSFIFVRFGQPMKIAKCEVWPSSDAGFATVSPIDVGIRGYNGASDPTSSTDGTGLASTGSIVDTTSMQTLNSTDENTEYDVLIVTVTSGAGDHYIAEFRIYSPGLTHDTGELWFLAGETLTVMDGRRLIGTRVIDGDGEVTLESGDAFTDETFGHTPGDFIVEPFMPHLGPGQSHGQTMNRRQVSDAAIAVQNSTGLRMEAWNAVEEEWDVVKERSPYDVNDDEGDEPPLREEVIKANKLGAEHDPRIRAVKDTPGPVCVLEIGAEIGP